ncbi:MAG: LITAF-like zinc ribbon domain-containing protein [Mariniblastus sp.]
MDKVRFACPRCQTIMQTGAEKIGYDVACPHCAHRFRLIESPERSSNQKVSPAGGVDDLTIAPSNSPTRDSPPARNASTGFEETRSTHPVSNQGNKLGGATAAVLGPATPPTVQPRFSCPYCQTNRPPVWKSEVSQIGWIVFAVLLVSCVTAPVCFVGLFIRDKYQVCSQCKIRLG